VIELLGALLGGLLLGFAGSFHCACMCGGIASGALFMLRPPTPAERIVAMAGLNGGRVLLYALAGGIFAGTAGLGIGPSATAGTYKILQWASAAVLMWVGLAMAGVLPRLALPERLGALSVVTQRALSPAHLPAGMTPLAMGIGWGMTPCPMAYAALFSATMTGSAAGGVAWMTGFGLGTIPAVMGASFGITWLARLRSVRWAEVAAGLAVAAFGLFTATVPWAKVAAFCLPV
jgi:hypothetical protein